MFEEVTHSCSSSIVKDADLLRTAYEIWFSSNTKGESEQKWYKKGKPCAASTGMRYMKEVLINNIVMHLKPLSKVDWKNDLYIFLGGICICFDYFKYKKIVKTVRSTIIGCPVGEDEDDWDFGEYEVVEPETREYLEYHPVTWNLLKKWNVLPKHIFIKAFETATRGFSCGELKQLSKDSNVYEYRKEPWDRDYMLDDKWHSDVSTLLLNDSFLDRRAELSGKWAVVFVSDQDVLLFRDGYADPAFLQWMQPMFREHYQPIGNHLTDNIYCYENGWIYPYSNPKARNLKNTPLAECFNRIRTAYTCKYDEGFVPVHDQQLKRLSGWKSNCRDCPLRASCLAILANREEPTLDLNMDTYRRWVED